MAHNQLKKQEDKGQSECQFTEGDQVFLQLQPYKKSSLKDDCFQKLAPKFMVLIQFSSAWVRWPISCIFLVILRFIMFFMSPA
jgi:hypothetical protein